MLLKLNITDLLRSKKLSFNKSKGHIIFNISILFWSITMQRSAFPEF